MATELLVRSDGQFPMQPWRCQVVRLRSASRHRGALTCATVVVLLLAGCAGGHSVGLDMRPSGSDAMRDLAYSVAASADCGYVEWLSDQENARSFTCERSGERGPAYIMTASDANPLIDKVAYLDSLNVPYVRGRYYLVTVPTNLATTAAPLDEFGTGSS